MKHIDAINWLVELMGRIPPDQMNDIFNVITLTIPGMASKYGQGVVIANVTPLMKEVVEGLYVQWATYVTQEEVEELVGDMQSIIEALAAPELALLEVSKPNDDSLALKQVLTPGEIMKDRVYATLLLIRCYAYPQKKA